MNVYICRPTRCTNSYNESLLIIKCSTCFGLFSASSGTTCFEAVYRNWYNHSMVHAASSLSEYLVCLETRSV